MKQGKDMVMSIPDPQMIFDPKREELNAWRTTFPANFYLADENLKSALLFWLGQTHLNEHIARLERIGAEVATVLNEWASETNRDENLPTINRYDGNGNRTEEIVFDPRYHDMGRRIYGSGIMALYARPGLDVLQMALFYLFSQNGEAGHCCPLACTAGAIKLLGRAGTDELKERFLPKLLNPDYDNHFHASQFLTELQGGSDVGANATVAVDSGDGSWRLYGEKWFCSVIDAQFWVLTARPEHAPDGTRGLMTFVAPRQLEDGSTNRFEVKKLKVKIGTRSLASAEIDLNGLVAYPVGGVGEGFKHVVDVVLNTSRLYNGFAAAGMTRRAYLEASSFARHRKAFGHPIADFPLIRRSLAFLRTQSAAQLATSLHVASLAGKIAEEAVDEREQRAFRFLVNANKYVTSITCTKSIREAIEVLGGNGTIEEFSVLPRLYRDAIVIESWEGAHNVLCAQVLRDMQRYNVHEPVLAHACDILSAAIGGPCESQAKRLSASLERVRLHASMLLDSEPETAQLDVRDFIDESMAMIQGVDLLAETLFERKNNLDSGKAIVLDYHIARFVDKVELFGNTELAELENNLLG
jgi:alkylation response protein AidB-like acyl-CoA dehydrogenase